jgi:hypothetical protein
MSNHEPHGNKPNSGDQGEISRKFVSDSNEMAETGVGFDGRSYRYQDYSYDFLPDALAYAKLDRSRPSYRAEAYVEPQWREAEVPTAAQQKLMKELGITFDGRHYLYFEYRYDRCADAIDFAQLRFF